MFIIKFIFNCFLEKEKQNILCLGVMIGGNSEILDKAYVITIWIEEKKTLLTGCYGWVVTI